MHADANARIFCVLMNQMKKNIIKPEKAWQEKMQLAFQDLSTFIFLKTIQNSDKTTILI